MEENMAFASPFRPVSWEGIKLCPVFGSSVHFQGNPFSDRLLQVADWAKPMIEVLCCIPVGIAAISANVEGMFLYLQASGVVVSLSLSLALSRPILFLDFYYPFPLSQAETTGFHRHTEIPMFWEKFHRCKGCFTLSTASVQLLSFYRLSG